MEHLVMVKIFEELQNLGKHQKSGWRSENDIIFPHTQKKEESRSQKNWRAICIIGMIYLDNKSEYQDKYILLGQKNWFCKIKTDTWFMSNTCWKKSSEMFIGSAISSQWQWTTSYSAFLENRISTEGGDSFVLHTSDWGIYSVQIPCWGCSQTQDHSKESSEVRRRAHNWLGFQDGNLDLIWRT